jgi:chemotaxis protein histidine kinase CheA
MYENDSEVLAAFAEESAERLNLLETGLLELERSLDPLPELLNSMFRDAHSIKAGANLLHLDSLELVAHRLENVLDGLRTRQICNGPEVCQALLDGLDLLRELVAAPTNPPPSNFKQRLAVLSSLAGI